jgi:hypothetical protein
MGYASVNDDTDWIIVWVLVLFAAFIAYMVLGYLVTNKKLKPPLLEPAQRLYTFVSACLALLFFGGLVFLAVAYYFTESGWYSRLVPFNSPLASCSRKGFKVTVAQDWSPTPSSGPLLPLAISPR